MRVIAGSAKHKTLLSTQMPEMQPTIDRVKEAVFSRLQFELEGRRVLDLFAGSGQLGIEALSRGAAHCDFVDASKASLDCVKKNLAACGLGAVSRVHAQDSFDFIRTQGGMYDVVFLDPPFHKGILPQILPLVAARTEKTGVIYCESKEDEDLPQTAGSFGIAFQTRYGKIKTTYYRYVEEK